MDLNYDVEADWNLLTTCNFRCNYCFIPSNELSAKIIVYGSPAQWVKGFEATGKTWLLHITGGEPTIYPGFVSLCEQLTRNHYLSINSNLSHKSIDAFSERVDPKRVHFINAAVHYDERMKKSSLDVFIERVHWLQMHHFNVLVSMVMTPLMLSIFPEVSEYFESNGLFLIPKIMRANYQGKIYPAAYSDSQKSQMHQYLSTARLNYAPEITRMVEPATIDMFSDDRFLSNAGNYRGKLCGSGYNFVTIKPDGTVVRCGSRKRLGNILRYNVSLLHAPKKCDSSYCPYFCEKYTSPQFLPMQKATDTLFTAFMSSLSSLIKRNIDA